VTGRHADAATADPGHHVGRHRRGTVYVVVHAHRAWQILGSLLADNGEGLGGAFASNIGWLEHDLKVSAKARLAEIYPGGYDVVVTPRDGDVPADVQQANRDWYATTAGATA
jgi:hypothetical protein